MLKRITVAVALSVLTACGGDGNGSPTDPSPSPSQTRIIAIEGNLNFGNVTVGETADKSISIRNTGTATLTVQSLTGPAGAGFVASWTSGGIPPNGAQNVTVRFAPTAVRSYSGTLTVNADHTSGSNTLPITATGVSAGNPTPPPASLVTLTGTVREANGGPLDNAEVDIRDGPDAGKASRTNAQGTYTLTGLQSGVVRVRAGKSGYDQDEQRITLSGTSVRADFTLARSGPPAPPPPPAPSVADVEYIVHGVRSNIITISNSGGGTSQFSDVALPWSYKFSGARGGQFLYVSAQNDLDRGCIKVQIFRRGSLYKESESCGAYVIATASGSF